jgi:dolichyl-phosphate-mannose-protein mannosyltransferase
MGFWTPTVRGQNPERWIILFGNPLVWWSALAGMLVTFAAALRDAPALHPWRSTLTFLGAGYVMNVLPFAFIERPMYLYHYFVSLVFSVMIAGIGVGALAGWSDETDGLTRFKTPRSARIYLGMIGGAALLFAYLAPMSYGWPLSPEGVIHRRWILERNLRP